MAIALPTGRRGRAFAASLAVLALVLMWLALVTPLLDWYEARADRLAELRQKAARESALIETLPELRKAAAETARAPARATLNGDTDSIAAASLQEQVQTMAASASAQVTSIETLPAEQVAAYRRIGVRVELNAQLPVLVQLLKLIEEAQPSMLVDDIHLTATPVGPVNVQLPIDAAFTVFAFRVGTAKDDTE